VQEVSVHSCLEAGNATCVVLCDSEHQFYIPVYLEGLAAELAAETIRGKISEEHAVMCDFMLQAWAQTDCALMFIEFDYDVGGLGARTVLCQRNEVAKKFYQVDTPVPFALMMADQASLPLVVGETTVRSVGRQSFAELQETFEELHGKEDNGKEA